jgi:hypothetical protein
MMNDVGLTLYEVPNLPLWIYGAADAEQEKYFLNFEKFSTKMPVKIEEFYPAVRARAIEFQEKYGDLLKKEKLTY